MLAYSLKAEDWAAMVNDGSECHAIGHAITDLGQFAEALPWLERAVAAKEKGDVYGRVDSASLGASTAAVARCHATLHSMEEPAPAPVTVREEP